MYIYRQHFYKNIIDSIADSFVSGDIKAVYGSIKHVLAIEKRRTATNKCLRVCDELGNVSQSLVDEKMVFRRHFSDLLGGFTRTLPPLFKVTAMFARVASLISSLKCWISRSRRKAVSA